jgi:hypothetical protein
MKKLIASAVFAVPLFFAANAEAGIFDWFCSRPCPPSPCTPATTASVQGTTSYSATYQPGPKAAPPQQAARSEKRWKTYEDYRREIKGW